jgi:hypothetical protein
MAIFKFDCLSLYCCFLGILGLCYGYVSLQIGIGEYVNFLVILMTVILHLFLILKLTVLSGKWIDLTTAIVFFTSYFISIYFAVKKIILNQKLKKQ